MQASFYAVKTHSENCIRTALFWTALFSSTVQCRHSFLWHCDKTVCKILSGTRPQIPFRCILGTNCLSFYDLGSHLACLQWTISSGTTRKFGKLLKSTFPWLTKIQRSSRSPGKGKWSGFLRRNCAFTGTRQAQDHPWRFESILIYFPLFRFSFDSPLYNVMSSFSLIFNSN